MYRIISLYRLSILIHLSCLIYIYDTFVNENGHFGDFSNDQDLELILMNECSSIITHLLGRSDGGVFLPRQYMNLNGFGFSSSISSTAQTNFL